MVGARFPMDFILELVGFGSFRFFVNLGSKGALFEPLVDLFLFFLDNFLYFIFHPKIVPLQKVRMTGNEVSFVLFDLWFKSALDIDFIFGKFMFLH